MLRGLVFLAFLGGCTTVYSIPSDLTDGGDTSDANTDAGHRCAAGKACIPGDGGPPSCAP